MFYGNRAAIEPNCSSRWIRRAGFHAGEGSDARQNDNRRIVIERKPSQHVDELPNLRPHNLVAAVDVCQCIEHEQRRSILSQKPVYLLVKRRCYESAIPTTVRGQRKDCVVIRQTGQPKSSERTKGLLRNN